MNLSFLRKRSTKTFLNGVHPDEAKHYSCASPIKRLPFGRDFVIPLSQHIGAPAKAVVKKGEQVRRGQLIAEPGGFVSVAHHSPVTGTVSAVELAEHPGGKMLTSIKIKADPFASQRFEEPKPLDWEGMEPGDFLRHLQRSGMVGLGGAAFPSHVKFHLPEGKRCKYLILNGCECEPYLTADHRVMLEFPDFIVHGTRLLRHFLKPEKVLVGIEANKMDAVQMLREAFLEADEAAEVVPLEVKYPQGAEKMLITALLEREVPSGKIPLEVETLVSNIGTVSAIGQYFLTSQPLIERVVTVTGPGIRRPANYLVPIGASLSEVLEASGGLTRDTSRILLGGPMMGMPQKSFEVPVTKGTSGLLALGPREVIPLKTRQCIRCGRCLEACPMFLNPSQLNLLARKGLYEEMLEERVMDCMECGSCSFVCPSAIPIVQSIRVAKAIQREKQEAA